MSETSIDNVVKNLCEWMKSNGFDIESSTQLKLLKSAKEEEGRCVISKETIEKNTTLISIPDKIVINYRYAMKDSFLFEFFEWTLKKYKTPILKRLDAMYLYLLVQLYDNDSFLHYFVKSMPELYDTPEFFDERIINSAPDYLKKEISHRLYNFKEKFKFISNLLNEFNMESSDNKSIQILIKKFTFESFRWVFCAINSRCFHIDQINVCDENEINLADRFFGKLINPLNEKFEIISFKDHLNKIEKEDQYNNNQFGLIPYIDFLNHAFKSNSSPFFDLESKSYRLRSKSFDEISDDIDGEEEKYLIKENQQVYITYGLHDNKTLLIEYGFVLDDNIYDTISCNQDDLLTLLSLKENEELLWKKASPLSLYSDLSFNKSSGPSWYLLKMLDLIVELNQSNAKSRKAKKSRLSLESVETVEIKNPTEIRNLFSILVESFQMQLHNSIEKLNDLSKNIEIGNENFIQLILKFCLIQLDIVKFNLNLINNHEKWSELF